MAADRVRQGCYTEVHYIVKNIGRARNWPLWAGDLYTEVNVKAGLTVHNQTTQYRQGNTVNVVIFAGEISRKCWQDISRGGNFHDTAPISFIKAYGFNFCVGVIFAKKPTRTKWRDVILLVFTRKPTGLQLFWPLRVSDQADSSRNSKISKIPSLLQRRKMLKPGGISLTRRTAGTVLLTET